MHKNIVLCGVGGQGTVLASKLIASAAMEKGLSVMSAETIGMAQRGGSVFSHLRVGGNPRSPMIEKGTADLILGFEPGEAVRMLPYLKPEGQMIVSKKAVMPVTATLSESGYSGEQMIAYLEQHCDHLMVIDSEAACRELGSEKVLNVLLLGAASLSGALGLTEEELRRAIELRVKPQFHELNFAALAYAREHKTKEGENK